MNEFVGKICPFCKAEIKEDEPIVVCPSCNIPHHEGCWNENKGCTTFGCQEKAEVTDELNKVIVCSNCGAELTEDQEFCAKCGTQKSIQQNICKNCGNTLQTGQEFCPKCGQKVSFEIESAVSNSIENYNKTIEKKQKKHKKIVPIIIAVVAIVALSIVLLPKIFKSATDYMAEANYSKAYEVAKEEKDVVQKENIIACIAKDVPDKLKDPASFVLRDAWYDKTGNKAVLYISGSNSYGAATTSYWYYSYDSDDKTYELVTTFSDFSEEKAYSWDDSSEKLEKVLKNLVKSTAQKMVNDSSQKIDKSSIENINNLFKNDLLDKVELIEIKK